MFPLQTIATTVLADIIRRQPPSSERTLFAWTVAVGPALARATSVDLDGHTLIVRAHDARWLREITRAVDIVLLRLQLLLGRDAVREVRVMPVSRHRTGTPRPSTLDPRSSNSHE